MFEDSPSENAAQRVMFYMGTKLNSEKSNAEGRPIFDECPFIKIFTAGDSFTIIDVPVWDDPLNKNSHTRRFPREWAAFKAGIAAEAQQGGTPLKLMPGISQAQVRELEHFHCHTVEQLADLHDSHAGKFMGIQALKQEARSYLLRAKGAAPEKALQRELAQRDQEIDLLKKQMQQLLAASTKSDAAVDGSEMPIEVAAGAVEKKRTRVAKAS